jgi:integrase
MLAHARFSPYIGHHWTRKGFPLMPRRIKDRILDTREARTKLPPCGKPVWRPLDRGVHIGYRRLKGKAGTWCLRRYKGKGVYEVTGLGVADDLSDANGVTFLDFYQAQDKARAQSGSLKVAIGPYTVAAACDDYLAFLKSDGRSDSAVKDAAYRIDAFIRPMLGKFEVAALEAKQLREWRAAVAKAAPRLRTKNGEAQKHRRAADGRARKATANRVLTTLKAALNHAFDEERVSSNKAWGRRVAPFEGVETARVRFLQIAEAKRLINACDPEFRPMVQAALQTGARYSELARLKVADFDADARAVFIGHSKSGKARHVRLSDEGARFFNQSCAGRAGDELIFRKANGGEWKKSHQARPMAAACERAKIKPAIGFHILRHTYASLMVKSGAPLHIVALNLGHISKDGQPDVRMVTRHYAHLESTHVAKLIQEHAPRFGLKASNVATIR